MQYVFGYIISNYIKKYIKFYHFGLAIIISKYQHAMEQLLPLKKTKKKNYLEVNITRCVKYLGRKL